MKYECCVTGQVLHIKRQMLCHMNLLYWCIVVLAIHVCKIRVVFGCLISGPTKELTHKLLNF